MPKVESIVKPLAIVAFSPRTALDHLDLIETLLQSIRNKVLLTNPYERENGKALLEVISYHSFIP